MADSKITALTAISTVDPTADPLVIVDVSDTSMAASGTTKKSTINQLLGSGGTATLASATITGDLTVDTSTLKVDSANDRVGLGIAAPAYKLHVQGSAALQLVLQTNDTNANAKEGTVNVRHYTNAEEPVSAVGGFTTSTANEIYLGGGFNGGNAATLLGFYTAANNTTTIGTERYRIASDGVATWSNVGGFAGTAMTLNANGLGVGGSPSYNLDVRGASSPTIQVRNTTSGTGNFAQLRLDVNNSFSGSGTAYLRAISGNAGNSNVDLAFGVNAVGGGAPFEAMRIDSSGNVISNVTGTAPTLATNSQMVFNLTSNTNLRISVRGTDGVTRTANITLA